MSEFTSEIEEAVAALADDAAGAAFVRAGGMILALSVPPDRVVWASAAAAGLRAAMSAADGYLRADIPALDRLRMLAAGLAPRSGVRIEPTRFRPDLPERDVAFRLVRLRVGDILVAGLGDEVRPGIHSAMAPEPPPVADAPLVDLPKAVVHEPVPDMAAPLSEEPAPDLAASAIPVAIEVSAAAAEPPIDEPAPTPINAAATAEPAPPPDEQPADRIRRQGVRRFIWSANREGRFTSVSAPLADVVGVEGADIVGRTWSEILDRLVIDEHGAIALCFARRATWSNETVLWRVAGTALVVPVELGGMPVFGRGHELDGYRGFGLCRADDVAPAPEAAPAEQVPADHDGAASTAAPIDADAPPFAETDTAAIRGDEHGARAATDPVSGQAAHAPLASFAFAPLQARIGAQFGTVRPVPLRSASEPEPIERAPVAAISDPKAAPDQDNGDGKPILSSSERGALRELARALGAKIGGADRTEPGEEPPSEARRPTADILTMPPPRTARDPDAARIFDRLPIGLMVLRGETPLFVNRFALDCLGYPDLGTLVAEGGASRLFAGRIETGGPRIADGSAATALVARSGATLAAEVRLTTVDWGDQPASIVMIRPLPEAAAAERVVRAVESDRARSEQLRHEAEQMLDLSGVAVATLDPCGRILSLNGTAERLFGYVEDEIAGESCTALLATHSHRAAIELIEAARHGGPPGDESSITGRSRTGQQIPLLVRAGRIDGAPEPRLCLLFRDVSAFRAAEIELDDARRAAENSSARRAEFLARVSHEIRTPLNAIIGFAEIMIEERFGTVGNDRYKAYLKDIRDSGAHVVSLVNDLLDLAKVTSGKSELAFASVDLGEVAAQGIGMLQPAAARERIIMRASFAPGLPRIVADERSIRQIAINLLSNAVRFTAAGGQVIVSTGLTDRGEVALRVRDTGIGMTPDEIQAAMEPFRQIPTAGRHDGTGLGLPLSKALAEANRGSFSIRSTRGRGTLVEIVFAPDRFA